MAVPFIALPALLAALDATCEARSCTVDAVAADIDAMADWTTPVTGALLDAMVAGTFVPSGELAQAVATVVGGDVNELFEVHPDVGRLTAGKRLIDDEMGARAATRAAGRIE